MVAQHIGPARGCPTCVLALVADQDGCTLSSDLYGQPSYWLWHIIWRLLCIPHELSTRWLHVMTLYGHIIPLWYWFDWIVYIFPRCLPCYRLHQLLFFSHVHRYRGDVSLYAHTMIQTFPCSISFMIRLHHVLFHDATGLHNGAPFGLMVLTVT